jgi:hypothetical protein
MGKRVTSDRPSLIAAEKKKKWGLIFTFDISLRGR